MPLFRFHNYGKKEVDKSKADVQRKMRAYYKCVHKGCEARHTVTYPLNNPKNMTYTFNRPAHNHAPPSNPRIRPEVKERAVAQMSAGATPGNVHSQIVRNASLPLLSADVPAMARRTGSTSFP